MSRALLAHQFVDREQQDRAATLGMWAFLATELMFFGPLFFGYAYGRLHFAESWAVASRHTDIVMGTANTAILLTSSLAMATAVEAAAAGGRRLAQWMLAATAVLGLAFLVLKGVEYRQEWREHLFPAGPFVLDAGGRLFFIGYFLMTGLHALHLAIGIVMVMVFTAALGRDSALASPEHLRVGGLYWHFVDAVWIFLYPILYLVGRAG